jgi:hypothetical protein
MVKQAITKGIGYQKIQGLEFKICFFSQIQNIFPKLSLSSVKLNIKSYMMYGKFLKINKHRFKK